MQLVTQLALKQVDASQRIIEGYAAYTGNRDRGGDVIDKGAFDRTLKENTDVAVFIGHDSSKLPVGEPLAIYADANGLFTKTIIYNTPDGDALLEVAKRRLAKGRTLGMSIGYRTVKQRHEGNTRHLVDLDLAEYSYLASPGFSMNPLATVTGVKRRRKYAEGIAYFGHDPIPNASMKDAGRGVVITTEGSYEDLIDELEDAASEALGVSMCCVCATFPDHVIVATYSMDDYGEQVYYDIPYTLDAATDSVTLGTPTSVETAFVPSDAKARATTTLEGKRMTIETRAAVWDAAFVSALPDDAFAHIEGDGTATKDDSDRTVPRSLRHYPHHNPDGSVDQAQLTHQLAHAAASTEPLGAKAFTHLVGHARGVDPHAPEWSEGAAPALLVAAYKFDAIVADIVEDRRAMERVGLDTKKGARLNSSMRTRLKDLHTSLGQILEWAESIEKGDDGKMRVDMFRHKLAMLELETVS